MVARKRRLSMDERDLPAWVTEFDAALWPTDDAASRYRFWYVAVEAWLQQTRLIDRDFHLWVSLVKHRRHVRLGLAAAGIFDSADSIGDLTEPRALNETSNQ